MPRNTRRGNKDAVIDADSKAIIKDASDAPRETKDKFLKRVSKEQKAHKAVFVKDDSSRYIVVEGHKVLEKFRNKAGSEYTKYWFNAKRNAQALERIKQDGGHKTKEKGKEIFIPLKRINGKDFKKA